MSSHTKSRFVYVKGSKAECPYHQEEASISKAHVSIASTSKFPLALCLEQVSVRLLSIADSTIAQTSNRLTYRLVCPNAL